MISNMAYIAPTAKLGENVTVEPFAYIDDDVVIGEGCWIGPHASVMAGTRMGKNCKVHSGAVIGGVPQDLKFHGEYTTCEIGDNNTFRECCTINRGTESKGKTVLGNNNLIMAYAHVGHDCVIGSNCVIVNNVSLAGEVVVGNFVVFGGHSGAHQFSHIGDHAMIAANTYVNKDVPPYVKAAHSPITYVGANFLGLRRRGFSNEDIKQIQDIFRVLFQDGHNYTTACNLVMEQFPESEIRNQVVEFIRNSKRGVLKPYNRSVASAEE